MVIVRLVRMLVTGFDISHFAVQGTLAGLRPIKVLGFLSPRALSRQAVTIFFFLKWMMFIPAVRSAPRLASADERLILPPNFPSHASTHILQLSMISSTTRQANGARKASGIASVCRRVASSANTST
jgi:hypothetical protein